MLGLGRHPQVHVVRWLALRLVARDRPANRAFTPVVGCQRQMPVAEFGMQLLQIVECCAGRLNHVTALVFPHVLFERVVLASRRDELPQPGRFGGGNRFRLHRAFDEGKQRQFGGHATPLDLLDDVIEIQACALCHAVDVGGLARVPAGASCRQRRLEFRHGETAADPFPHVGRRRRRCRSCLGRRSERRGLRQQRVDRIGGAGCQPGGVGWRATCCHRRRICGGSGRRRSGNRGRRHCIARLRHGGAGRDKRASHQRGQTAQWSCEERFQGCQTHFGSTIDRYCDAGSRRKRNIAQV